MLLIKLAEFSNRFVNFHIGLWQGYLLGLHRFRDFRGTSSRAEFWRFSLVSWSIDALARALDVQLDWYLSVSATITYEYYESGILTQVYILLILVPTITLMVRRLHDAGLSGWFALLGLLPMVGFWLMLAFALLPERIFVMWRPNRVVKIPPTNATAKPAAQPAAKRSARPAVAVGKSG